MKTIGSLIGSIVLLAVAACAKSNRPNVSAVEQEIIEAAIAGNDDARPAVRRGLFRRSSVRLARGGDKTYETLAAELRKNAEYRDAAFHEALEDFLRANSPEDVKLVFRAPLPETVVLVSDEEVRKVRANTKTLKDADAAIHSMFGGIDGIYQTSRPGIDAHQRVALICLSYFRASGTVWGRFYILKFDGKRWTVDKDDLFGPSWMS
jgi:hypothetical protein